MKYCNNCGSSKVHSKGIREYKEKSVRRYQCQDCNTWTQVEVNDDNSETIEAKRGSLYRLDSETKVDVETSHDIFVVTCAQNDTSIDTVFYNSLLNYVNERGAKLIVIPTRYKNPSAMTTIDDYTWPSVLVKHLSDDQLDLSNHIKVMGNLQVQATAVNPLSGLNRLSKGKSVIIGHPQIEMTTMPVNKHKHPIVFTTTGTISDKNYSVTKSGIKGEYAHNKAAIVVEVDRENDKFHVRHLVAGEDSTFCDLDRHYTPDSVNHIQSIPAIVLGDEHVLFMDKEVKANTFTNQDSLVNRLNPEMIVRHDVIDCYTVSHHHKRDKFLQYLKYKTKKNSLEDELYLTCNHMVETTPEGITSLMVPSNHHNHVTQFLNEANPDVQPWNAKLYHYLKYMMLDYIEKNNSIGDPFKMWFEENYKDDSHRFIWPEGEKPYYVGKWNVSNHGHQGPNGSRGTRQSLSKVPEPMVIGHSHSPGIKGLCIQVGTSSEKIQDWNSGPSSWASCHAIIHPNDTVQLIFITDNDYYLKG